jgi:broad specificity phosphatase PhoE
MRRSSLLETLRRVTTVLALALGIGAATSLNGRGATRVATATGTLRIYLARHGQTDWNAEHRIQGSIDTHLNATGREQAAALAQRLQGIAFDRVYCSRLSRSRETAEIAHGRTPIDSLAGLNEESFGKFQGLRVDGSDSTVAVEWRRRSADPADTFDGGESLEQLFTRVDATVQGIRKRHASGNILIVGHGGTNKMVLRSLLGLTMEQAMGIQQDNDELYLVELDPTGPPRLFKLITEAKLKEL